MGLSVLALCSVGVIAYFNYHFFQQVSSLQHQTQEDTTSVQAIVKQAQSSLDQIATIKSQYQSENMRLQSLKSDIISTQERVASLGQDRQWVLSEVDYLLFLANERVKIAQDIPTAIVQLETAEKRLRQLGDPAFANVQASIASDIAQLKLHPDVDRQELWIELQTMNGILSQLPLKNLTNSVAEEAAIDQSPFPKEAAAWKNALWKSWLQFKSLIRVTKEGKNPVIPAYSLQDKAQILHTMQLMTEQAQWGVLHANTAIFQTSLKQLSSWIDQYMAPSVARDQIVKQIDVLLKTPIDAPQVDIDGSLESLSQVMRRQGEKPSASKTSAPSVKTSAEASPSSAPLAPMGSMGAKAP